MRIIYSAIFLFHTVKIRELFRVWLLKVRLRFFCLLCKILNVLKVCTTLTVSVFQSFINSDLERKHFWNDVCGFASLHFLSRFLNREIMGFK